MGVQRLRVSGTFAGNVYARRFIFGVLVFFLIFAAYFAEVIRERQHAVASAAHYNIVWAVTRMSADLNRFGQTLAEYALPRTRVDKAQLQMRADIVKNRLSVMNSGEFLQFTNSSLSHKRNMLEVDTALNRIWKELDDLKVDAIADILNDFDGIRPKIAALVAAAREYSGDQERNETMELLRLHLVFSLIVASLLFFGGFMLFTVMRQYRTILASHAELVETAKKRDEAEVALLKRERLSTLGQLTATVAHELRNPLSAIRNTLFVLQETVRAKGVDVDRQISRVERSIARCDQLIASLLDYSRCHELTCKLTPLDRWLREVLGEQSVPDGIELEEKLGAPDCVVYLDGDRFRRAIINLLDNAAQALNESVTAPGDRRITVNTRASDPAEIIIEDTGPGIAPDVLLKVFEPLFSTKSFGTGLGLPTVRQIIEQHGGTVTIDSELGRGTRVCLRVPLADEQRIAA
jgi:signal transduction histidine kinase